MSQLKDFVTGSIDALIAGDLNHVVSAFAFPAAIYVENRLIVCRSADELRNIAQQYNAALGDAGAVSVDVEVIAQSLSYGPRHSIWVANTYLDAKGWPVDTATSRYFCSIENGRPRIHILEYLRVPVAERVFELPFYKNAA